MRAFKIGDTDSIQIHSSSFVCAIPRHEAYILYNDLKNVFYPGDGYIGLRDLTDRVAALEKRLEQVVHGVERVDTLTNSHAELAKRVHELEYKNNQIIESLNYVDAENKKLAQRIDNLVFTNGVLARAHDDLNNRLASLEAHREQFRMRDMMSIPAGLYAGARAAEEMGMVPDIVQTKKTV